MKIQLSGKFSKMIIITLSFLFALIHGTYSSIPYDSAEPKSSPGIIFPVYKTKNQITTVQVIINNDGIKLKGNFFISEGLGTFPTVILLHGFPGNETDVLGIGKKLSEAGINALTFNYSGTFGSEGKFNFFNAQKDISAAYEFIRQPENIVKFKVDTASIIMGGYSFGGGMAFTYAANHPEIGTVFSVSGNDHGEFIRNYRQDEELKVEIDSLFDKYRSDPGIVRFAPGGIPKESIEMKILESNPTFDLKYCAPLLASKKILLIGGWDDRNVSIEKIVLPLYRALADSKATDLKIRAVQDNHSFRKSRDEVAQIIIEWIKINNKDK